MAPEQAAGKVHEIGPAAHVYALGAILYHLLTGRPPFRADTPQETLQQVNHDDPVPPRKLNPLLARDLETICLKCLLKEPQRRYASAAELADDLHRFLNGENILARPACALGRSWKWLRRRKIVWAIAAAVLVLGLFLLFRPSDSPHSLAVRRACAPIPWEAPEIEIVRSRPDRPDQGGFEVLERSIVWDFRGWKPAPAERAGTEPIEPTFSTTVLRLRKRPDATGNRWLVHQFRTSGLAVYPRCENHPYRVRKYQFDEAMPDDKRGKKKRRMTAWELIIDLAEAGNQAKPFEVVIHALWWNAFQDQHRGKPSDWVANRFDSPTQDANITVLLPRHKRLVRWGFSDFAAGTNHPYPSDQAPGTHINADRGFIYWEIPHPRQDHVYRIDWSWQER
jgi:hypothetical protein